MWGLVIGRCEEMVLALEMTFIAPDRRRKCDQIDRCMRSPFSGSRG